MEIFITVLIVAAALFMLWRSAKRKAKGECECGSCSQHCPMYEKKDQK